MDGIQDPTIREAAGLGAIAEAAITAPPLAAPPVFSFEFSSVMDPALDGTVKMRYATVGDTVTIESMLPPTAGPFAEAVAALSVLVEVAPPSWYRKDPGAKLPVIDLRRMVDPEAITDLWAEYNRWRSLFRAERARAKAKPQGSSHLEGGEGAGA